MLSVLIILIISVFPRRIHTTICRRRYNDHPTISYLTHLHLHLPLYYYLHLLPHKKIKKKDSFLSMLRLKLASIVTFIACEEDQRGEERLGF